MKMPLDIITRQQTFNVHAYDKRTNMALVELTSEFTKNPYRVLLEFGYEEDYDWTASFVFDSIKEAFKLYDQLLSNILLEDDALRAEGTI